jgi:hypothetical protein
MDAEAKQQAVQDVLTTALLAVNAYRKQRRGLYRTFGLDELVKAFDALDEAVCLHEATKPLIGQGGQVHLDLRDPEVMP